MRCSGVCADRNAPDPGCGYPFMDLRGLREPGLLLMHRLGHENARIVLVQLQQQRGGFRHHRNKLLVAHPRRVKEDVIAQMADLVDHLTGVVDRAIVSTKLDHCRAERAGLVAFSGATSRDCAGTRRQSSVRQSHR